MNAMTRSPRLDPALTNTCAMGMLLAKLPFNRGASCDLNSVVRRLRNGTSP